MTKRLMASVLAASLALTTVSAAPARAGDEFGKFLLGAATLFIVGSAISNSGRNRNAGTVTRHAPAERHVHTRRGKIVPGICMRSGHTNNGPRNFFSRNCLRSNMHNYGSLPGGCKKRIWYNGGKRTVFSARCLQRRGWVVG